MGSVEIEVLNWDEYQGEAKRYESTQWFRIENKIWMHPLWDELSDREFKALIFLFCFVSQKAHDSGRVQVKLPTLHRMSGIGTDVFVSMLKKCVQLKILSTPGECPVSASDDTPGERTETAPCGTSATIRNVTLRNVTERIREDAAPGAGVSEDGKTTGTEVWEAYAEAFTLRYKSPPVRNAKQNALCKRLVQRLGADEAPDVARFYVGHQNGYYAKRGHPLDCLVADAEKIRTEWKTGSVIRDGPTTRAESISAQNQSLYNEVMARRDE